MVYYDEQSMQNKVRRVKNVALDAMEWGHRQLPIYKYIHIQYTQRRVQKTKNSSYKHNDIVQPLQAMHFQPFNGGCMKNICVLYVDERLNGERYFVRF